jgi:hypothetical protein
MGGKRPSTPAVDVDRGRADMFKVNEGGVGGGEDKKHALEIT